MIYVTGDTHGLEDFYKLHIFAGQHPELTKDDYVIIAGDFGGVWSEQTLTESLRYYNSVERSVKHIGGGVCA